RRHPERETLYRESSSYPSDVQGSQENHVVPALPSKLVRKFDLGSVISAAKVGKQVTKRQPSDRD
ncbi:hypothetical protein PC128_g24213, partial [Phytophthora cactorum]